MSINMQSIICTAAQHTLNTQQLKNAAVTFNGFFKSITACFVSCSMVSWTRFVRLTWRTRHGLTGSIGRNRLAILRRLTSSTASCSAPSHKFNHQINMIIKQKAILVYASGQETSLTSNNIMQIISQITRVWLNLTAVLVEITQLKSLNSKLNTVLANQYQSQQMPDQIILGIYAVLQSK